MVDDCGLFFSSSGEFTGHLWQSILNTRQLSPLAMAMAMYTTRQCTQAGQRTAAVARFVVLGGRPDAALQRSAAG